MMDKPTAAARAPEAPVWDALQTVVDPELGASLVGLAMIRAVTVAGAMATVELVLTLPACPLAAWLAEQVWQTGPLLPGIQAVDVRIAGAPWQPPTTLWQGWLGAALTPDEDEHRGDASAQNPLPQHSDTKATPDPSTQIRGWPVFDPCACASPCPPRIPRRQTLERGFL